MKNRKHRQQQLRLWPLAAGLALVALAAQLSIIVRASMISTQEIPAAAPAPSADRPGDDAAVASDEELLKDLAPREVSEFLIDAIVQVESGGKTRCVGQAGERGLMQIKAGTWKEVTRRLFGRAVTFDRAFDPETNRRVGRRYLADVHTFLLGRRGQWRSDERSLLLACYNAGPSRALKSGFDLRRMPAQTRDYVARVTALHDVYLARGYGEPSEVAATTRKPANVRIPAGRTLAGS